MDVIEPEAVDDLFGTMHYRDVLWVFLPEHGSNIFGWNWNCPICLFAHTSVYMHDSVLSHLPVVCLQLYYHCFQCVEPFILYETKIF